MTVVRVAAMLGWLAACGGGCGRRNFNVDDAGPGGGADAPAVGDANRMFVTAGVFTGALGGLAGADAICNDAAAAARLPGTYVAWLSTSTVPAAARLAGARGWVRTDGEVVADRPTELTTEGPRVPLSLTEDAVDLRSLADEVEVFTGTTPQGQARSSSCADWTDGGAVGRGGVGSGTSGNGNWTSAAPIDERPCSEALHLYCFGVDRAVAIGDPPPPPAPRAFVSRGGFDPTSTRAAADALCVSEAAEAGLTGTFLAALPIAGASTASRFTTATALYHRTDGVALGRLLSEPLPRAFINRHADGTLAPISSVWTGGRPSQVASGSDTCASWSSGVDAGGVGRSSSAAKDAFVNFSAVGCVAAGAVYCLEN